MTNWIISASILILLVVMMRYLFQGKISLRLQYALWIFVAIRLLLPISFGDSVFSVENVTNELKVQTSYYAENNTINHLDRNIETTYQDMVQTYENLDKGSIQKTYLSNVSWETLCYKFLWRKTHMLACGMKATFLLLDKCIDLIYNLCIRNKRNG